MGFDHRNVARRRAPVPLAQPHRPELRCAVAETLDLSLFVQHREGTSHLELAVEGVACAGCIRKIEGGLKRLPGVVDARLNFTNRRLAVDWDENELAATDLIAALEDLGYPAHP